MNFRNVGDHLKHVFPKLEAERSHPRRVNGRSKLRLFRFCFFVVFSIFFGRTDLRKGVSRAKFCGESDFEVHLSVAPPKLDKMSKNNVRDEKL